MFDLTKRATDRPFVSRDAAQSLGTLVRRLADAVALPWLAIACALSVFGVSAATITGWRITAELPDPDRAGMVINVIALGVALLISIGSGMLFPAWWRRVVAMAMVLPALLFIVTSGNIAAALAAGAVITPAAWLGRRCAAWLLGTTDVLTAWLIGSALGFGFVANVGFLLGTIGLLRPAIIWPILVATTIALLITERQRLREDITQVTTWLHRTARRDRLTLLLAALALALVWYNTIGALSPETASDSSRVRLPTASYFAQTHHLAADRPELLGIVQMPAAGEIANAVIVSVGPLQAVTLVVMLQGIACALAIFAVGRRLHSSQAGLIAAFAFYSMPLVAWLSQTAYLDLLVSFLASAAALAVVSRDIPTWRIALVVGFLAALGVGVKLQFGYVAIGLAVFLGLTVLWQRGIRAALFLGATIAGTSALTIAPWFARSIHLTGQIPGLALTTGSLVRTADDQPTVMADLTRFGFGRSFGHLARSLMDMTLFSAQFEWPPTRYGPFSGLIGFSLLGLLPLALIVFPARRRLALALLAGGGAAFLLWFYTAQYLRYSLPVLALLCPLAGTAYAVTQEGTKRAVLQVGARLAVLVLIICGVATQLQVPSMGRTYILGREDAGQYLDRNLICCAGYPVIRLINAEPAATRVLSTVDMARIYTPVPINTPQDTTATATARDETTLLKALDEGGYSHIVVDRNRLGKGWEASPLSGELFLRRNTLLVGGQKNVYLYRLLPPNQRVAGQPWATGSELLPPPDAPGCLSAGRLDEAASQSTAVPVTPGGTYLLTHQTRADAAAEQGRAEFALIWRDATGRPLAITREDVPTSPLGFHQFSTVGAAPADAATVEVRITAREGAIWFTNLSLGTLASGAAQP